MNRVDYNCKQPRTYCLTFRVNPLVFFPQSVNTCETLLCIFCLLRTRDSRVSKMDSLAQTSSLDASTFLVLRKNRKSPEGGREDISLFSYTYLCKLLVNFKYAGSIGLGPAEAAGVAIVLDLGDSIHGVVAKGL